MFLGYLYPVNAQIFLYFNISFDGTISNLPLTLIIGFRNDRNRTKQGQTQRSGSLDARVPQKKEVRLSLLNNVIKLFSLELYSLLIFVPSINSKNSWDGACKEINYYTLFSILYLLFIQHNSPILYYFPFTRSHSNAV